MVLGTSSVASKRKLMNKMREIIAWTPKVSLSIGVRHNPYTCYSGILSKPKPASKDIASGSALFVRNGRLFLAHQGHRNKSSWSKTQNTLTETECCGRFSLLTSHTVLVHARMVRTFMADHPVEACHVPMRGTVALEHAAPEAPRRRSWHDASGGNGENIAIQATMADDVEMPL